MPPTNTTATLADPLLTVAEVAALAHCSAATVRIALKTTSPASYPPPLRPAGRKGPRGPFLIRLSEVEAWVKTFSRFLDAA